MQPPKQIDVLGILTSVLDILFANLLFDSIVNEYKMGIRHFLQPGPSLDGHTAHFYDI